MLLLVYLIWWRIEDPYNLSVVQLARQFMKLNSFICLMNHLSGNLKIRHKFFQTNYTGVICATYIPRALTIL